MASKSEIIAQNASAINIGKIPQEITHVFHVSLPNSLDSVNYPAMKLDTIKAWYLLLSLIREATPIEYQTGVCSYTFPSLDFARTMNMKQPRGTRVRNALRPLVQMPIQIIDEDGIDAEEQNTADTHLLMYIGYRGKDPRKPITVLLHPVINNLIFHSRENIELDYLDLARLSSITSIHVFTVLWRLHRKHIHTISIEDFKEMLGVSAKYKYFARFAQVYITPVEADIRANTSYKDFHFSYSGQTESGKKVAVTHLHFNFDAPKQIKENKDIQLTLKNRFSAADWKKLAGFTTLTQETLIELWDKGYAVSTYMNLILKVIRDCSESTFCRHARSILLEAGKSTLRGKYGKLLTKELKDALRHKPRPREIVQDTIQQYSFADQQKWIKTFKARAKEAAKRMTIDERQEILQAYRHRIEECMHNGTQFDPNDILTAKPDGRRASYRAFVTFLAEAYRTGILGIKPLNF